MAEGEDDIDVGRIRFGAALRWAEVFRGFSILALVGAALSLIGGIAAIGDADNDGGWQTAAGFYGAAVGVAAAAMFAFFGYMLEIAVAIYNEVWHVRVYAQDDEDEDA